jgi:uncharacterized protein YdeI (YjbR/CyaY-like superfamily)
VATEPVFFESPAAFRAWLEEHHETAAEVWVGYYKKATGKPTMTWAQAVEEALCFGWIDGKVQRIDEHRHRQRFTPRRRNSNWSAVNIAKVAELRAQGRMTPAGEAAFAARRDDRSAVYSYERRHEAAFDADQEATFRANEAAWAWFSKRSRSYRQLATFWVVSAKRPETRARRLASLIESSAAGRRVPPLAS